MIDTIRELAQCNGVSGNEHSVAQYIKSRIIASVDKVYEDALGNLVAVRRGSGPKVMLMAHMDQIGLVATFVDEKGFIRVSDVGYVNPRNTISRPIVFENGVMGVFTCGDENKKDLKLSDCYIDIGAADREEAMRRIEIGMTATFVNETFETGNKIVSNALDNRIGCYCLIEAMRRLKEPTAEIYVHL